MTAVMLDRRQSNVSRGASLLFSCKVFIQVFIQLTQLTTVYGQAYCGMKEPINGRFDQPCLPLPGRVCKFNCFKLDGSAVLPFMSKRVVCMPNLQWSPAPFCDSSGSFLEPNFQQQPRPGDSKVLYPSDKSPQPACPDLNPPEGGYTEGICVNASMNNLCVFGCLPGYVKKGVSSLKCLGDRWDGTMPECKMTPCSVTNLSEQLLGGSPNDISCILNPKFNRTCSITCDKGWSSGEGKSDGASQCTINGWVPPLRQVCKEVICPDLTNTSFINGKFTGYCTKARYNQFCSFSCRNGYYLSGETLAICTMEGKWKPENMPKCLNPGSLPSSTPPPSPGNATEPTRATETPTNQTATPSTNTEATVATTSSQVPTTEKTDPPTEKTNPPVENGSSTEGPPTNATQGPQVNQTNAGQVREDSNKTVTKDMSTTLGTTTELTVSTLGSTAKSGMANGATSDLTTFQSTSNSPNPNMTSTSSPVSTVSSEPRPIGTPIPGATSSLVTEFTTMNTLTTIFALPSTNVLPKYPITFDPRMTNRPIGTTTTGTPLASKDTSINIVNNNNVSNIVENTLVNVPTSTETTRNGYTSGSTNGSSDLTTPIQGMSTTPTYNTPTMSNMSTPTMNISNVSSTNAVTSVSAGTREFLRI